MAADRRDAAGWVGREISHYKVIERLGSGGMGEVYRAEDQRLGRHVALKRLKPEFTNDEAARRRFETEARAVARLSHTHITTVFDFDAAAGFLTLELVEGFSLEESLAGGVIPPLEAVRIVAAVARALEHAHARNVVHRDIKPSNILLDAAGVVKLTDFGLARVRDDAGRTSTGMVLGTAAYMSPEQIRGRGVDRRSDLFSLGVVLYRALTGRLPWNGDGLAILYSILHDSPPLPDTIVPDLPAPLVALVERLLRKLPEERFDNAGELARDLETLLPSLAGSAAGVAASSAPTDTSASGPGGEAGAQAESAGETGFVPRRRPVVTLLGRDAELRRLLATLELVRFGSGRTLLLEGEAGVGKTRLMEELTTAARSVGVLTLSGRCAYQEGRYYGPFVEALEDLHRRADQVERGLLEGGAADPAEGGAVPGVRAALELLVRPSGPVAVEPRSREQVWLLVDSLLKSLARESPLLLCLEDLHWADEGTLSLLHHLARNIGRTRMMLVGVFRPEELLREGGAESPFVDLLRVLSGVESVERIQLTRLDETATAALVAAALPGLPLARELAPAIHRRSQGNPLFILEILRYLEVAASGSVIPRGLTESMALPRTISDLLLRRLTRLSQEDRDLLELAAVEGDMFDLDTLAAGSGLPRVGLLRQLRTLSQKHHLIEAVEDGYRFSHQLVREVLLREMPADLRREYHAIVADLHLARYGDRLDVAGRAGYHLYQAERLAEAVPHLVRAGDNARRLFLYDRALVQFDQAVDALTRGGPSEEAAAAGLSRLQRQRCELLLLVGRPDEAGRAADEAWRLADLSGDPVELAAAEERKGEVALARGDHAAAAHHLDSALAHYSSAGDRGEMNRCRQRLGTLASRRGEYARAREHFAVAEVVWRELNDDTALAGVQLELGEVAALTGGVAEAETLFQGAIALARDTGNRSGLARGLLLLANLHFQSGDTSQSLERYHEAIALAAEIGDIQGGARCMANLGNVFLVRGDTEQALVSYRAARARFEEIGDQRGAASALVAEGNVDYSLGRFAQAAALYSRAVPVRTSMGDRWGLANVLDNMSVAEYYLGRWAEALHHARSALAIREELGDRPGCAESHINLANLLAILGADAGAADSYAKAETLAAAVGNRRKQAAAWLARACVSLWDGRREEVRDLVARVDLLGLEEPALRVRGRVLLALADAAEAAEAETARFAEIVEQAARAGFPEQTLAELGLVAARGRANGSAEALRLLGQLQERLAERPISLLQLEAIRLERELQGGGACDSDVREARLLETLTGNLPADWRARPRFVKRLFPIP